MRELSEAVAALAENVRSINNALETLVARRERCRPAGSLKCEFLCFFSHSSLRIGGCYVGEVRAVVAFLNFLGCMRSSLNVARSPLTECCSSDGND